MADSLHSELVMTHTPKLPLAQRENLSLKEEQTVYRLFFDRRRACSSFRVDGDIITAGNKCDYIVLAKKSEDVNDSTWDAIFVELKGTDVEHALKQLDGAMSNSKLQHPTVTERHARIVAKSFPSNKANPKYEQAKRAFKKKYACSLKQVSSGSPDKI